MSVVVVSEKERHNGTWEVCLSQDGFRYNVIVSKAVHDGDAAHAHYQAIFNARKASTEQARERAKLVTE